GRIDAKDHERLGRRIVEVGDDVPNGSFHAVGGHVLCPVVSVDRPPSVKSFFAGSHFAASLVVRLRWMRCGSPMSLLLRSRESGAGAVLKSIEGLCQLLA